jgi:hypothetical protein
MNIVEKIVSRYALRTINSISSQKVVPVAGPGATATATSGASGASGPVSSGLGVGLGRGMGVVMQPRHILSCDNTKSITASFRTLKRIKTMSNPLQPVICLGKPCVLCILCV